jgi:hypothetical protein
MKILILGFMLYVLCFNFALAQDNLGLVPCGGLNNPCTTCDLITLANKIIDFLFKMIIAPLAALGILAAGIVMLTAGGSESRISQGKQMLFNILIGFAIAVSAWLIVSVILAHFVRTDLKTAWNPLTNNFPACK